jgi:UDP-glucose 4-epimerase
MKILSNSTILVTGGNGAVGANLVNKLLGFGSKVTVLDDFSQSIPSNLKPRKNLHVINGDINDIKLIKKIFTKKFDYVFHLAARFANELSTLNPIEDLHVNIQGTLQLLIESAKQNPKRFLYTSSSSLFGVQEKLPLDEDSLPNPSTPYAVSKLTGEYYCKVFQKMYNLKYSVVRLSNSYGPIDPPGKFRNVIPNFIESALKNKNIIITGTGNETRDFTYIDDTVNGILLAATKKNGINQIFNLGTGKETKIRTIAELIIKNTGSKSKIVYKKRRSFDPISRRRMNIDKASNLLHYNPEIDVTTGIQKTCHWFLNR